jgi:hypothetical protein
VNQLNATVRNVFQDLVERRLWPIALVLVLALVAIPVLLSRPAASEPGAAAVTPPATPAVGSGGSLSAFQPVVNTEGSKSSEIRKRLAGFNSKDPFKVQGLPKPGSATGQLTAPGATGEVSGATGTDTVTGTAAPGTSGTAGSGESTSGSGDSTGSGAPTLTYFTYTVDLRFGKADNLDKKNVEQFRALPSSEDPVVVFMGVKTDGKTAVFLVSSASGTTGEGNCEPDDTCTFLYMKEDQQQTFEAVDASDQVVTYVLKLLKINVEETDGPKNASSSSSRSARRAARRAERTRRARAHEGFSARVQAIGF